MKIVSSLDQARNEMLQDEKLSLFLNVDKLNTEKIKYAIIYFLDQAKQNQLTVYKTHLLKFFSLSELYYAQKHSNSLFNIQYQALEQGPVPMPIYRAADLFNFSNSTSNFEEEVKALLPFSGKSFNNGTMRIFLKDDCVFNDYYFSVSDLMAMEKATKKIIELKKTDKISKYLHENSKSWNKSRTEYLLSKGKKSQDMTFVSDFPHS